MYIPPKIEKSRPKREKTKRPIGGDKPKGREVQNFVAADKETLCRLATSAPQIEEIKIAEIKDVNSLKIRDKYDEEKLQEFLNALREGAELPSLTLMRLLNGELILVNGGYCLLAQIRFRSTTVKAIVLNGQLNEALRLRLLANSIHPTPLTRAEKRRNVRRVLLNDSWWHWSDNIIAGYCGVSGRLVGTIRDEIISDPELSAKFSQITTRLVLRKGKMYEMEVESINAKRIRKNKEAEKFIPAPHNAQIINSGIGVQPGEVFLFHNPSMPFPHIIYNGDGRDKRFYRIVFARVKAGMLKWDPPYGVDYTAGGHIRAANSHELDKILNDNLSPEEHRSLLDETLLTLKEFLKPGSAYYVWTGLDTTEIVKTLCQLHLGKMRDEIIWIKKGLKQGTSYYKKGYEKALFGWTGENLRCWSGGNNSINVFDDNLLEESLYTLPLSTHPCPKSITPCRLMIENALEPRGIVLDPMVGSGTTVVAAHLAGCIGVGVELQLEYVAVAVSQMKRLLPLYRRTTLDELPEILARFNPKAGKETK